MTLDVKVSLGSYVGVFIDIEDAAFKMRPSTMMRNSSRVILSIPRLSGVDDGEYRRWAICRVARGLGRARSHPTIDRDVFRQFSDIACPGPRSHPLTITTVTLVLILFIEDDTLIIFNPPNCVIQPGGEGLWTYAQRRKGGKATRPSPWSALTLST